jgi:hypothetical protein
MGDIPVDGVEIKCTLSGAALDGGVASFGLQRVAAKRQEVWFFDTIDPVSHDLRLLLAGVVLRLRRKKDRSGTSTLKLRPASPELLVGDFRAGSGRFEDYTVEYDWAHKPVLAASMGTKIDEETVDAALQRPDRVHGLYSKHQLRLLHEAGTPPPDPFVGLRPAGPVTAHRWEDVGDGPLTDLRAEHWEYAGGRTFLELSLRAPDCAQARQRRDILLADLERRHLTPDSAATSKTETVLRELLGDRNK